MQDIKKERRFIFAAVLALTLFGILMVYEASSLYAYKIHSDSTYFFKRQFLFFVIGAVLFFLTLLLDLEFLRKYNKEFLILTLLVLIVILFAGKVAGGAKRWFHLASFNFQPSETLKIFFLLYCADYFYRKGNLVKNFRVGLVPLVAVLGVICFLLLLQPTLGTTLFWITWLLFFLFISGARKKHLLLIVILGLVASFFLIKFYPYRFRRITSYLDPFADSRGAGFQSVQSQIAYGQGGIFGVGFGESRQKLFFLPAAHTDFIFSIIAEEFGLWGALGVLFLFFIIFHKMVNIAKMIEDKFKKAVLWGITVMFSLEVVLNAGVSCGLFPITGLALPFLSYGGTNLITHYILLGLFFNASRRDIVVSR